MATASSPTQDALDAAAFVGTLIEKGLPLAVIVPLSQSWVTARILRDQKVLVVTEREKEDWE